MNRASLGLWAVVRYLAAVAVVAGLSACGAVGKGNAPVSLKLTPLGGNLNDPSIRMYQCFQSLVTARVTFTDGSFADYTNRVTWSSSSPGTVKVSNGDIAAPGGGFYAKGALIPASAGQAIVRADYLGLTATLLVTVGTPSSITVEAVTANDPRPTRLLPGDTVNIGVGTTQDLSVVAVLDGVEKNVELSATWSFDAANDSVATLDPATGLLTGLSPGGPLIATAHFPACDLTASANVAVWAVKGITINPEFANLGSTYSSIGQNLLVGNTEKINVLATFIDPQGNELKVNADGSPCYAGGSETCGSASTAVQDISLQTTLSSSDSTIAGFVAVLGVPNMLFGIAAGGPVNVFAEFTGAGVDLSATPAAISVQSATLESITLFWTPRDPTDPVTDPNIPPSVPPTITAGSDEFVQFTAIGNYDGGAITQDITRQAVWTSSDPAVATVGSAPSNAGVANSANLAGGSVTITAGPPASAVGVNAQLATLSIATH
jgi:hypothetical protein